MAGWEQGELTIDEVHAVRALVGWYLDGMHGEPDPDEDVLENLHSALDKLNHGPARLK